MGLPWSGAHSRGVGVIFIPFGKGLIRGYHKKTSFATNHGGGKASSVMPPAQEAVHVPVGVGAAHPAPLKESSIFDEEVDESCQVLFSLKGQQHKQQTQRQEHTPSPGVKCEHKDDASSAPAFY